MLTDLLELLLQSPRKEKGRASVRSTFGSALKLLQLHVRLAVDGEFKQDFLDRPQAVLSERLRNVLLEIIDSEYYHEFALVS